MAIKKLNTETRQFKLTVTDVNHSARSATLEGEPGDAKYIVMLDYKLFDDWDEVEPLVEEVGDLYSISMTFKKKPVKPKSAKAAPVGKARVVTKAGIVRKQAKGLTCHGSGTVGHTYKGHPRGNRVYADQCPYCGKNVSLNAPYYQGIGVYASNFRKHQT